MKQENTTQNTTEQSEKYAAQNITRKEIAKNMVLAAAGLFTFGLGVYFTIQANIGVAPWDALNLGLSDTLGIKYGTASIAVSLTIIIMDLLLKEKIGVGTFFDAVIVGKTVDFCNWLDLVSPRQNLWSGLVFMFVGLFIMGFSQFIYMKAALCCGPRDAFMVALSKRIKKIPIGMIAIIMLSVVLLLGWLLGGPIGIGTVIAAFGIGPTMQIAFTVVKFDPVKVKHQDIITTIRVLIKGSI